MARLSNAQALLFTEISIEDRKLEGQGSTTLTGWLGTQQLGQAKALVTDAVVANRGVVTHTVGDAVLSSFSDPAAAMRAALDIRRRVGEGVGKRASAVIRVRMGMGYGPVRVIAGKVSGDAVTAAGVLLEKSGHGEILVDAAMRDALGGNGPKSVPMQACGPFDGISAFRAVLPDLPVAEPADDQPRPVAPDVPKSAVPREMAAPAAPGPTLPAGALETTLVLRFQMVERSFGHAFGEITLGRAKDSTIVVASAHVSRNHARIVWDTNDVPALVNLSVNGSCVRFDSTGRVEVCRDQQVPLEGAGSIALAAQFGDAAADVVHFKVVNR